MAAGFGAVGLGATLAGGLLSAYGANKQGEAAQQAYHYRAQVSKINADINRQNAAWSIERGEKESQIAGMKAGQQMGAIKVAQAASGIDINSGTAADVRASQKKIADMDTLAIRENAARIAYDYETKATMDENQATLDEMSGKYAKETGNIKAAESILGTVSSVSSKWQQAKTTGMW